MANMESAEGDELRGRTWEGESQVLPHAFPFLFAILTVTALVASNPYGGIRAANLTVPLFLAIGITSLAWVVAAVMMTGRLQRSLTTTVISLLFLLSGYLFGWLRSTELSRGLAGGLEVGFLGLLSAVGMLVLLRIRWSPETARFLNLAGLFGVLVTAPAVWRSLSSTEPPVSKAPVVSDTQAARPDIYLIVLDAYTGAESLKRHYGFDNTPFLDSLRTRGFSIADGQVSNYMRTFLSVGSMLNRTYLDDLMSKSRPDYRDVGPAYKGLEFNQTVLDLLSLGYRFYYVGSSYPPLARNRLADDQYAVQTSVEFERFWVRTTGMLPVWLLYCSTIGKCIESELPFRPETAAETDQRVAFLVSQVDRAGPKFVYAHLLLPHRPYRFDSECRPRPARWTVGQEAIRTDSMLQRVYVEQVECTNRMILKVLNAIRSESTEEPVVILQSDHGSGGFLIGRPPNLAEATTDQIRERFDVFAAYSGPYALGDSLAASRSPVNVFRTLLRVLWGIDEPPLDDRSYWSELDRPLFFQAVNID